MGDLPRMVLTGLRTGSTDSTTFSVLMIGLGSARYSSIMKGHVILLKKYEDGTMNGYCDVFLLCQTAEVSGAFIKAGAALPSRASQHISLP